MGSERWIGTPCHDDKHEGFSRRYWPQTWKPAPAVLTNRPHHVLFIKPVTWRRYNWEGTGELNLQACHWTTVFLGQEVEMPARSEEKRREAVWEILQAELSYLHDYLMVLKHVSADVTSHNATYSEFNFSPFVWRHIRCAFQCFMEPLKQVQVEGHLMFAEPRDLFGNLDELCSVSRTYMSPLTYMYMSPHLFKSRPLRLARSRALAHAQF